MSLIGLLLVCEHRQPLPHQLFQKRFFFGLTFLLDLAQNKIEKANYKVCLDFHIGKCKGPCEKKQSAAEYNAMIAQIEGILNKTTSSIATVEETKSEE